MHDAKIDALATQVKMLLQIATDQSHEITALRTLVFELARQSKDFPSLKTHFLDATSHFAMKDLLFEEDTKMKASMDKVRETYLSLLGTLEAELSAKK